MAKPPLKDILAVTRWTIIKANDGTYTLVHPHFRDISFIPNYDEADELLRSIHGGAFIGFVRAREKFYAELHKRIVGDT